ncbi:MAG: class I SAM-dependent methyltransferase [Anaerolineales bacterium]
MAIIRKRYDSDYFENPLTAQTYDSLRNRTRLKVLLARKRRGSLLEIGFGNGDFLRAAAQHYDVRGIDISEYAVSKIDDSLASKVCRFDVESDRPLPGHNDVIVAFNVFEHLEQPERVIRKAFEGLREGGLLIGSVPLKGGLLGRLHTAATNFFDRTHSSTYSPNQWRRIFHGAGFARLRFFGEVLIGSRISFYLERSCWRYLSFNLMFDCEK